ncbi:hypothetical protein SUDANB95_04446 [Actinosynnema sp. ALI-1.44]|uniref:DUF6480 family protein n=1 Tax=Saccharothrix mutabilis subsp. mutabilis TaxID=66855 RepID=A0ABP3CIW9_9PSEU
MTATPPDPDPATTPGLEPGGGVAPGDTPPDSGSTTSGLTHHEPQPSRARNIIALVIVLIMTVMVVGFIVGQIMGWANLF